MITEQQASQPFSMDWAATFDIEYPPTEEIPQIPKIPAAVSGRGLFNREVDLVGDIIRRWWRSEPVVIDDETSYVKMRVVSATIKALRSLTGRQFPVLIIATSSTLVRWRSELMDWSDSRVVIFGNSKAERKLVNNESVFFLPDSPQNFDVMLVSREQFVRDSSSLPPLFWSAMFVDDLTPSKAAYHQSLAGISDVQSMFVAFIVGKIEAMSETDVKTIGRVLEVDDVGECTLKITVEDAVAERFIEERVVLCPMTTQQLKATQEQFIRHRDTLIKATPDRKYASLICQIVRQQRLIATHRALRDGENLPGQENLSGKFRQLIKILTTAKNAGRKVMLVCADVKEIALVHGALGSAGISHGVLEGGAKQKQEKLARQFNATDGFAVLVVIAVIAKTMIALVNADTIMTMDLDFVPLDAINEIVGWYRRAQHYPEIIRLLAENSMEKLMFEGYWVNKSVSPLDMEIVGDKPDCGVALTGLMHAAKMAFSSEKVVESSVVLKYSSDEPLAEPISLPENIWEVVMPHVPKSTKNKAMTEKLFWDETRVDQLCALLWDFGWNRWDKFNVFGRKKKEIETVCLVLIKKFFVDPRQYPKLREAIGSELHSSDVKKFQGMLPGVTEKVAQINGKAFLKNLENLIALTNIRPKNPSDIPLDDVEIPRDVDGWTLEDDKHLLFNVYVHGMTNVPIDFHPEVPRDHLRERVSLLLSKLSPRRSAAVASSPQKEPTKKMGLADHQKIVNNLMTFGYPDLRTFKQHFDISLSDEALEHYVECLFNYCYASVDERKRLLPTLVDKLPKYTTQKIPQRRSLFEKIRTIQTDFANYSGEDIEFLTAIAFHGMGNAYMSPILNVSCLGSCSEAKLYMRLKVVLQEDQSVRSTQKLPENIQERLPLRINDMLMLQKIGTINPRPGFHNSLYIYPIGYKCCCVCPSPNGKDPLMWVECTIGENDNAPVFSIKPWKGDSWRFSGPTPDAPFSELRARLMKKAHAFVQPIDGHEMFGLTSAFVNRLFLETPGCDQCVEYRPRYFRSNISLVSEWPTIGRFDSSSERQFQAPKTPTREVSKKQKNKKRAEDGIPLRLDFSPLFAEQPASNSVTVDIRAQHTNLENIVDRYEAWKLVDVDEYFVHDDTT